MPQGADGRGPREGEGVVTDLLLGLTLVGVSVLALCIGLYEWVTR